MYLLMNFNDTTGCINTLESEVHSNRGYFIQIITQAYIFSDVFHHIRNVIVEIALDPKIKTHITLNSLIIFNIMLHDY